MIIIKHNTVENVKIVRKCNLKLEKYNICAII